MATTPAPIRPVLVDTLGRVKARVADLTNEEKALRNQLVALYGLGEHEGDLFRAVVINQSQERLDNDAVRAILTKAQLRRCSYLVQTTIVRVSARVQALANR